MEEEYFIYVGRLDKLKGVDILLKAWKLMGENAPRLLVCGTGPMEDWCREYIAKNGLTSVEMRGFVPNTEAKQLIANSQALILPTQWYEGFPMTIVEAYSVGTPVIGSDLGNVGNLIEEGVSGEVFDSQSPQSLVLALKRRISSTQYNIRRASEWYGSDANYNALYNIYKSIKKCE